MIKNLSPSRASQFKTCPRQFKYANIDKISEPTTEVQAKGTTVHQALEDLFDLPQPERTTEKLHNLFRDAWTKVRSNDEHHNLFESVEEERDWGVDGLKLLNNYMQIEDPTSFEPLERERWVRGSIEDLNLRGILDRMDRNNKGELVIVDYKSGKAPMAKYKEPRFFALKLYALLIKEELNEMPAELKLIYLKNSTIHTLKINEEDIVKAKAEIIEIWESIKKAFKEDNFPATKNNLCDWCYYKPICPVFNKEAPNTDELKKFNEEINELNECLDALNMFNNPNDLPKDSPLSNLDEEGIQEKLNILKNKRDHIQEELQELLRK
ncbi:PD-(D/E)XK nuclease family protein [Candidatus Actinomarina]|nr:PD-(D/E)XK nuclease family protein [Candidatus Actinomarina sp.]